MSLTKCPACGSTVSKAAAACPACGHPLKKTETSGCAKLIAIGLALVFASALLSTCFSGATRETSVAPKSPAAGAIVPPSAEEVAAARAAVAERRLEQARLWRYDTGNDAMSSKPIHSAVLRSKNAFELDFPYRDPQRGMLMLRQHPEHGTDVVISIERGQILCRFDGCSHDVRFDEGSIQRWTMLEPVSNQSELIFVRDARSFISKIRQSKLVRVQLDIYDHPPVTLEFDVSQFDHDRWLGKPPAAAPPKPAAAEPQGQS